MKLTKDKKIYIPDGDNWWWREGYEQKQFFETMRHVSKRDVALDIGAHVGIWSKRLSEIFKEVIAFEPVPEHVECWHANTINNNNATIHEFALSNKTETVKMKQTGHNSGMSSLEYNPKQLRSSKEIEIETRPLNGFNLPPVDFMKIDVEGHELAMLEGANQIIAAYVPTIFIEIHDKERKKDTNAYDWLINVGYKEILSMSSGNYLFKHEVRT